MAEQPRLDGTDPQAEPRRIFQDEPASAVMYRLGGRMYPVKSEPRCATCNSPHRLHVERMLIRGYSYSAIHRDLPEDAGLSRDSIRLHATKNHLPLAEHTKRAAIEERARELGKDIERHEQSLVDAMTFARLGVQDVFERMASGDIQPTIQEGIKMAQLLHDLGVAERGDIDMDLTREVFSAYMDAFLEVVEDEETRQRFSNVLASHPVMRSFMATQYGGRDVIDVEPEPDEEQAAIEEQSSVR